MLVHGVPDPVAFVEAARDYTLAGRAELITCPTWVCNAELDDIGASAPQLVEALTCDKTFVHFTAAEGAGDHCEAGRARSTTGARSAGSTSSCTRSADGIRDCPCSGRRR